MKNKKECILCKKDLVDKVVCFNIYSFKVQKGVGLCTDCQKLDLENAHKNINFSSEMNKAKLPLEKELARYNKILGRIYLKL